MEKYLENRILIQKICKGLIIGILIGNVLYAFFSSITLTWWLGMFIILFNIVLFSILDVINNNIDNIKIMLHNYRLARKNNLNKTT